eukprot:2248633-Prymnesium_polylepis.1
MRQGARVLLRCFVNSWGWPLPAARRATHAHRPRARGRAAAALGLALECSATRIGNRERDPISGPAVARAPRGPRRAAAQGG